MKYRKLRIAWSAGCGILCLLLIVVLWVRSYSIRDSAYWETNKLWMEINSIKGHVVLFLTFQPGEGQVKIRHEKITPNDEARVKDGILGFFYFREEDTAGIHFPFWFLALASTAAAAAAPWFLWRFSLRTLLIAMTLVAIGLGLLVMMLRGKLRHMSHTLDSQAESIVQDIRTAFGDVQHGPLSLHQAMIVKYATPKQLVEARHLDREHHWEEIPDRDLELAGAAFYGSDPISWRYFVPAFMVWSLRYFRVNASFVSDQTIYTFDVTDANSYQNTERFATLSPPQCHAVCRFLRYMASNGDFADDRIAKHALEKYWDKFCEAD